MTYLPEALSYSAQTERTIRLDLESGEMDSEGAALALMDLYGWLYRDAREQVEEWHARADIELGFEEMCRCGHQAGFHDADDRCTVLGCECKSFEEARNG